MKTVLIFRGLPKGRRETLINNLVNHCQVDEFARINTPQPKEFVSKEQLRELSVQSFNDFKLEISKGTPLILVNNANLKHHHYYSYMTYAQHYGYLVGVVLVPWNDMTNRDLSIDSGGELALDKFQAYRKAFEWGDYSKVMEYRKKAKEEHD